NGLVFTVAPETASVTFDLRVDGRQRPEQVRLGREGRQAAQIPLTLDGTLGGSDALFAPPPDIAGRSARTAAAHGFRLWRTRPAAPDQPVTLDEETRERLRSLGYID